MSEHAPQGTQSWRQARAKCITASRFADAIAVRKDGKPSADRTTYLHALVFERLSGQPVHEISGRALTWGTDIESYARATYEVETGNIVVHPEFVTHPDYPFIGASSDGWVDDDGVIEIKVPFSESVHTKTLLEGMPPEHIPQVQGNMLVTGRKFVDFCSYDPRQAQRYRLYVERIDRDDAYIARLLEGLLAFERDINAAITLLENRRPV